LPARIRMSPRGPDLLAPSVLDRRGWRVGAAVLSGGLGYFATGLEPWWWAAWLAPFPLLLAAFRASAREGWGLAAVAGLIRKRGDVLRDVRRTYRFWRHHAAARAPPRSRRGSHARRGSGIAALACGVRLSRVDGGVRHPRGRGVTRRHYGKSGLHADGRRAR